MNEFITLGKNIVNNSIRKISTSSSQTKRRILSSIGTTNSSALKSEENPYIREFYTKIDWAYNNGELGKKERLIYLSLASIIESPAKIKRLMHKIALKLGIYNKKPITFKPAKTIDEAIEFGRKNGFYKKVKNIDRSSEYTLDNLNTLNQGLTNVHNKTKGRSIMVRNILFEKLDTANAGYAKILDHLSIPNNKKLTIECVYHEMGHVNHAINTDFRRMLKPSEFDMLGGDQSITFQFYRNKDLMELIKLHMRDYALKSPAEFVADRFRYAIIGIKMPKEIDMAYDALKGSDIVKHLF